MCAENFLNFMLLLLLLLLLLLFIFIFFSVFPLFPTATLASLPSSLLCSFISICKFLPLQQNCWRCFSYSCCCCCRCWHNFCCCRFGDDGNNSNSNNTSSTASISFGDVFACLRFAGFRIWSSNKLAPPSPALPPFPFSSLPPLPLLPFALPLGYNPLRGPPSHACAALVVVLVVVASCGLKKGE